ncbi:MAG: protein translocase SEC61 complex subunit gamma [Nanoarchaeota archaeon]|nr:protein translocase SEC61 complex subunit gamma [Nanoarchaeota archaeon]MBU1321999.1 protein translocase SEC61 complex subunit gamma [Nanoarchaeota archaeon]MBU1597973.1 protein translocase SEC61 complex subunit gamma [Nanoarchaeota archaeon]MBU2442335.1 protein translocase SEC61 complex subunit gamma [Nanoarchaeota archaeon]
MKVWGKLKDFFIQCKRVLRVTRKPDKQEFWTIAKVSGLGILVIGLLGFILHFLKQIIIPG